jgi:hypothetical protein
MAFPPFSNLSALIGKLEKLGKYGELRNVLVTAWRAQSCLADLRQSQDCYDVLEGILKRPRSDDNPELLTTERALLMTAIMLYARATSTSGQRGERGSIQLERGKLTSEQWKNHQALVEVRNQALAHVYPSQQVGGFQWHREIVFAIERPSGMWEAASASNQVSYHKETVERLGRMLPVAKLIVKEKFQKRLAGVTSKINEASVPRDLFIQCQFDPVLTFGSEEAVQRVLAGKQGGEASFWTNW